MTKRAASNGADPAGELLAELTARGLVEQITNLDKFKKAVNERKAVYIGFDPTGPSLHLGHLVQIRLLQIFARHKVPTIALLGGATAMIGDPSGKSKERQFLEEKEISTNTRSIELQLRHFLPQAEILNNASFYDGKSMIEFLRDVGKFFTLSYMLEKESVQNRIKSGLSFTEFSYMLLQSYDFFTLFSQHNTAIQAGGSDQFGNITAGIEIIRKKCGESNIACGIVAPLLTDAEGKKFGKTEQGAIYLNPVLSSPYRMYQYLVNTSDESVNQLLYRIADLEPEAIEDLIHENKKSPQKRLSARALAENVVRMIHGEQAVRDALRISSAVFSGDFQDLPLTMFEEAIAFLPHVDVKGDEKISDLISTGGFICASKSEARKLITQNGISVNGKLITDGEAGLASINAYHERFYLIRKGKRNFYIAEVKKHD